MKALLVAFMLLGTTLKSDVPRTAGIPWDKALHFSAGYIVTDVAVRVTDRWWAGVAASALAATVKESSDPVWDWQDFGATMLGCGVKLVVRW